jgi:hypothetical protein
MTIDLASFEAAMARIDCGAEIHTIRWEAGDLSALDHGDAEGELALAALGGTNVACLNVLTSWRRHRHDHRLLSALTRGPGDVIPADDNQHNPGRPPMAMLRRMQMGRGVQAMRSRARMISAARSGQATMFAVGGARAGGPLVGAPFSPLSAGAPSDDEQIEILARLGGTIARRLAATTTAHLLETATSAENPISPHTPALTASLFGRARNALSAWYGDPGLHIDVEVLDSADTPYLHANPELGIGVGLPLSWVVDVWGRGLAILGERFTLAVVRTGPDRIVADTIGHDLQNRRHLALQTLNGM